MPKSPPRLIKLVFFLAAASVVLPIVCEYEMDFYLLLWLAIGGSWRLARVGGRWLPPADAADRRLMDVASAGMQPIHWGVLAYVLALLVAAVLGSGFSEFAKPLGKGLSVWSHQASKMGLQWFVLSAAMLAAVRRGWNPRRVVLPLLVWMVVHFVYCAVQRATGIDWTHGLHATLPQHRFAYGVYRVSGFMGHPLNLAYNLELLLLAAVALAVRLGHTGEADELRERRLWWGVALVSAATLLISGSRFVLIVIVLVLALTEGRRALKQWRWVGLAAAAAGVVLWAEGSIVGRFGEVFAQNLPLTERFPRLLYWQVHWRMFLDHPLFGVTMASSDEATAAYYTAAGVHDNLYSAHNLFLQTLSDTGLLGALGLLALFVGLVVSMRRLGKLGGVQGTGYLIAGTLLTGLMQNDLRDSEFIYAFWFLLSLLLVQSAVLPPTAATGRDERKPPQNLEPATGR